ncbi:MAG: YbaN family protein [Ectothiorhodospiraceae bacterium]|nr:YbaN family protein [Ectothiorhodospiraceae bacterium]MCH8506374.1 YbaN family protein [Ectothiorhodospiraceae bacterium]
MLAMAGWRALASLALTLGAAGVVVPGLPTVPFLLVAAWAGGRGWPQLEARLLAHPVHGPTIRSWRERRAVPRKAKWMASALILSSIVMIAIAPVPMLMRWLLPPLLLCVALWLWSRPDA